MKNNPSIPLLN